MILFTNKPHNSSTKVFSVEMQITYQPNFALDDPVT